MDLVVDANIIFAALIKKGLSYELLFKDNLHLFTPEYIFTEFEKHKEEILKKTEQTTEDFFHFLEILKKRISFIPLEELSPYVEEALFLADKIYVLSDKPSTIKASFEVNFKRPRKHELKQSKEFFEMRNRVIKIL